MLKEAIANVVAEIKALTGENADLEALVAAIQSFITKLMDVIMGTDAE